LPILRHPQGDLADTRHQRSAVVTRSVAQPTGRAFTLASLQCLIHLGFQHLLQRLFHNHFQQIPVFGQDLPQFLCRDSYLRVILLSGHLAFPFFSR
jgi:hypothetical protein